MNLRYCEPNAILYVNNIEQQAAMLELDGQISDGMWENARPLNHWKIWCDAKVEVAGAGQPVGRTFNASKTNYNFTDRELLDVVEKRMIAVIRIARKLGIEVARTLEHAPDCADGLIDWTPDYMQSYIHKIALLGITTDEVDAALVDKSYGPRELRSDLLQLKQIIKERL